MPGDLPDPRGERHADVSPRAMHAPGHVPGVSVCAYFVEDDEREHEAEYRTPERAYDWSISVQGGGGVHDDASHAARVRAPPRPGDEPDASTVRC